MPVDLKPLLDPSQTAVLTMELQRGVVGDQAVLRDLADEVAAVGLLRRVGTICRAARAVGARVVHCTAEFRADRAGSTDNAPILRALAKGSAHLVTGTSSTEIVPELEQHPSDLVSARVHGMTPFTGTGLDQLLRNLGVRTVVATGVSLNIGVTGMVMSAMDLGYTVVVPTDAVVGVPREYAEAMLEHTVGLLAYRCTTDELLAIWKAWEG